MRFATPRLQLRPIESADWPLYYRLSTDKKVIEKCFDLPADSEIRNNFNSRLPLWNPASDHWLCLVITEKQTGADIGVTGFIIKEGVAEVGYLLLPDFNNKGYGTESLKGLIEKASVDYTILHYQAVVTEGNLASERVLQKCGFSLNRVDKQAYSIGGTLFDDHIYTLNITNCSLYGVLS